MMVIDQKKRLTITLTEPVVFLRSRDPSGRHPPDSSDSSTLVRGILTLNVTKPTGISSIEVELTGELEIDYQEDVGPRHIDLANNRKIYSSTATIFRAGRVTRGSNSPSVGPTSSSSHFNPDEHPATTSSRPPSLSRGRSERRSVASVPLDLGPTPPYTAADLPSSLQPRHFVTREDSAQTLEELRQTLRDNLERQTHHSDYIPPSSRPHITISPPGSTTHSNLPSNPLNTVFPGGDDIHNDDLLYTSPSLEGDPSIHDSIDDPTFIRPYGFHTSNHSSRAHSPELAHRVESRAHGNGNDPVNTPPGHSRFRLSLTSVLDVVRDITSRAPSRSHSIARLDERERGRPRVRVIAEEQSGTDMGEQVGDPDRGSEPDSNISHLSDRGEHREHHLLGLGRFLGLDHDKVGDGEHKSKDHGENWREFKAGTYSYPFSFLLPPALPPTFSLPYGSLSYTIRAVAHRPGAFTSKLSCQVPLVVVAAPAIGDGEDGIAGDPGPIIVQREWRGKMAYSFGLTSRMLLLGSEGRLNAAKRGRVRTSTESLVEIGAEARANVLYGTAMLDLTLLPTEKLKIWRLVIFVEQCVSYVDERERFYKDDDKRQVKLLEVHDRCTVEEKELIDEEDQSHKGKHKRNPYDVVPIPLLPTPLSPHRSPLLQYLPSTADPSTLAGPGPYAFSTIITLPGCDGRFGGNNGLLCFTVKQKNTGLRVEHSLRTVMRVESVGDGDTNGPRLVDIAVQTPITILSCRCVPEYQALPEYSQIMEGGFQDSIACPCRMRFAGQAEQTNQQVGNASGLSMTPSSTPSFENESVPTSEHHASQAYAHSTSTSHGQNDHATPLTTPLPPPATSQANRTHEPAWSRSSYHADTSSHARHPAHAHARSQSYSAWTSHVRAHSQEPPFLTPHTSQPPSPLARYERLVSGLESEAGEAPPSYESLSSGH